MYIELADKESLIGEYNPIDINQGEHKTLLTAMCKFDYPLQVVVD